MGLKSAFAALSLSLVCLLSPAAQAGTITLNGVGGASTDGVYVYPYFLTYTDAKGTLTDLMSCLNFDREVTIGESWTASVYNVLDIGPGGLNGESRESYIEDAWLFKLYATAGNAQQITDIQFAIWSIMDAAVTGSNGYTSGNAAALAGLARTAYNFGDFSFAANEVVFIPTAWPGDKTQPQIYMADPPPAPTPEPSGLMLLGTGLLGSVMFLRHKSRA